MSALQTSRTRMGATAPLGSAVPAPRSTPDHAAQVLAFCAQQVEQAARQVWPEAEIALGAHAPSVTSYVQQLIVNGRPVYAKYSLLGLSLVSIVRGRGGPWPQVRAAQAHYILEPGALLAREHTQLRALAAAGLAVAAPLAHAGGVLFIAPAPGPTLAQLVAARPESTADLLARALETLQVLQQPGIQDCARTVPIAERGIEATHRRKFTGPDTDAYLAEIAARHHLPTRLLTEAVAAPAALAPPTAEEAVLYGDFKPEHVLHPGGPENSPVFLDPGLRIGSADEDLAKLISRLLLNLLSTPSTDTGAVLRGVGAVTDRHLRAAPAADRAGQARRMAALWLMDTANITSTYLSAPTGLPLPEQGRAVVAHAEQVLTVLTRAGAHLTRGTGDAWQTVLETIQWAVAR